MKQIIILMLAGLLFGTLLFFMNKVALDPVDGPTVDGKTVDVLPTSTAPSETKFEPLDLSENKKMFVKQAVAAQADSGISRNSIRTMGNPDAEVKMFVFSSLTCSHCSYFHGTILKDIEEKYVDTGKVALIYIDFPFDKRALAGAMLVHCVKPESYFPFLNVLFENQKEWAFKPNAEEIVATYASLQGMTRGDVRACLADNTLKQSIINNRDAYMKKYDIDSTPTTVIVKGEKKEKIVGANASKLNAALNRMVN